MPGNRWARVKGRVIHYAYEGPHNDSSTRMCVCVDIFVPCLFSHCPLWFHIACVGVTTACFHPLCAHMPSLCPPTPHSPPPPVQVMYSGKRYTVIMSLGLPAVRQTLAARLSAFNMPELPAEGKEGWRGKRDGGERGGGTIKMQNHHCGVVQHLAPSLLLRGSHLMMERVCV